METIIEKVRNIFDESLIISKSSKSFCYLNSVLNMLSEI